MGKNDCLKEFLKYTSMNVLGMIGLSCYILADTFFIAAGLGSGGLTALNLAIPVYSLIHGSGLMIGMGAATRYAIQKGRKNPKEGNRVFTNAVYAAAFFAGIFIAAGLFAADALTALLGADETVFSMTRTYLKVILLFSPAFLANNLLLCFVRNDGAPQLSMAAMISGSLSNILLDYLFIFPCNMGIFGAVFATGLAPIISMLILSVHFIRKKNGFRLAGCGLSGRLLAGFFSIGAPSLITEVSSGIVIFVFNGILLSLLGNTGVAAYGIVANLSLVIVAVYTGVAQGIQPIISRNYGMNKLGAIAKILRYALCSAALLSAVIFILVFRYAHPIAALFNSEKDPLLQTIAVQGLKLYFTACPFVGFNVILSAYFTSTDFAPPAHAISLLRGFFLIIPMAYLLSGIWGTAGVWCAFPATELIVAIAGAALFLLCRKRLPLRGEAPPERR